MWERVQSAKEDSDTSLFYSLCYAGELLTKLVTAGLIACVENDNENHRYSQIYNLVRADGVGDWSKSIDEIIGGPTSHHLTMEAQPLQRELTQKFKSDSWQHKCVSLLYESLVLIGDRDIENVPVNIQGKVWFSLFVRLRNQTKGHGAPSSEICSKVSVRLEESIRLFFEKSSLFDFEWAYLHQNLSGKYKVSGVSKSYESFTYLKSTNNEKFQDGLYIFLGKPLKIELIESDSDISDFYFPNGGFNSKRYEVLSYITGNKDSKDSSIYLSPPGELPSSETEGFKKIRVINECFTNIPDVQSVYINRIVLEKELEKYLIDDRHAIITLVGKGGIGKTSLALSVLRTISRTERFSLILWFSARDIDLLEHGPKRVKPAIIDEYDIANQFSALIEPPSFNEKDFKPKQYMEKELNKSSNGSILVVLDNFETVNNPAELFNWLDTYIRMPNKILITSRIRDFKGDYPIDVPGLTEEEFNLLVDSVANTLNIKHLLTKEYLNNLYSESDGHPYVIKILLGELANQGKVGKIERIVARKDELLTALFERTFTSLSLAAKRVLLTLSNWRSTIPYIALESILLSDQNESMNVESAIEELHRYSFVEMIKSKKDGSIFLYLPLSAFLFGKKKLTVSPLLATVQNDTLLLRQFGVGQIVHINDGLEPRLNNFFQELARQLNSNNKYQILNKYRPILNFICGKYNPAWMTLAILYEENQRYPDAILALQNYLESPDIEESKKIRAWKKMAALNKQLNNHHTEAHALIQMCQINSTSFASVSTTASRIIALSSEKKLDDNEQMKRYILSNAIKLLKDRLDDNEGSHDDYTQLAWLYIHNREIKRARIVAKNVLKQNPLHGHSLNILNKIHE